MKRLFLLMLILVFNFYLTGCNINKKASINDLYIDWYNCIKLPSMENPFVESYDGYYTIKIDKNNNVIFKSIEQEILNGHLEFEENKRYIEIKITFENGFIANGKLFIRDNLKYLQFNYKDINYSFTSNKGLSKEEFILYRNNFNKFLKEAFVNDNYPSIEEVENNPLYCDYTNFIHIDPCCNGPKIYIGVMKALISYNDEDEVINITYNNDNSETLNVFEINHIVLVKLDGTFEKLNEIKNGQCFLSDDKSIFYFECNHKWDEGILDELSNAFMIYTCIYCKETKKEPNHLLEHSHHFIDGLCECKEFDENWLNENFRLSDEKTMFDDNPIYDFGNDVILLTLKHTSTYIELSKRHFLIDEIVKVEYLQGPRPPEYFFKEEYKDKLDTYCQVICLYVDVENKEEIIKLIKELEKLPFVKSANPNYYIPVE